MAGTRVAGSVAAPQTMSEEIGNRPLSVTLIAESVEESWHNDAVPAAVGTAARSWIALGTVLRWAIIIFPFAYIAFVGTILACVGTYSLEKRMELWMASDCGKLHQISYIVMWAMIIFILTASTAIIFTWEHVLWVKVAFPVGSLLLEIIGVSSWIYGTVSCGEYFNENAPGVWGIFVVSTIVIALLACLAWYNALAKAPCMLRRDDDDYQTISDKEYHEHARILSPSSAFPGDPTVRSRAVEQAAK